MRKSPSQGEKERIRGDPSLPPGKVEPTGLGSTPIVALGGADVYGLLPDPPRSIRTVLTSADGSEWTREDRGAIYFRTTMSSGPEWKDVRRRRTYDAVTGELLQDAEIIQGRTVNLMRTTLT